MRIAALYTYPVKACRALALEEATLGLLGLEGDRRFAFVDSEGCALAQREQPLLATVSAQLNEKELRLDFGGLLQLAVSLADFVESTSVEVWGTRIPGRAARGDIAADYFGARVRLVALQPSAQRAFVDSQPVLVVTTPMLAQLNARLAHPIGLERFRANIVLEGEADWRELRGDEVRLQYVKPCGRCEVTTIDQASGTRRGPEPLQTLQGSFAGNFGVYCRVARSGRVRRGERLEAL